MQMAEQKKYSQKELERLIEETTRYGAVYAYLHFDAHGKDEDTVKHSLVDLVDRITKEQGVLYCVGEVLEPYRRGGALKPEGNANAGEKETGKVKLADIESGQNAEKSGETKAGQEAKPGENGEVEGNEASKGKKSGAGNNEGGKGGETGEKDVYSTSAQVTILCNSFIALHQIALRYGLVGVEILSPQHIRMGISDAQSLLLNASQASQEFTAYILQKVLPPEEREKMEEKVRRRADLARQLIEKQAEKK